MMPATISRAPLLPGCEEEDEPLQLSVRQSLPDRELLDSLIADVLEKFPQCGVHLQEGELVNDEVVSDDADVDRAEGGCHLPDAIVQAREELLDALVVFGINGRRLGRRA